MRNYWNIAIGISFVMHSLVLGAGSLTAFNKNVILNDRKEIKGTKEIKITVRAVQRKEIYKTRIENSQLNESKPLYPPPYIKNVMRKLMGEDKEGPFLAKAKILEKNTDRIVISEKLENSKLKSNPAYMRYYKGLRSKLEIACNKNYTGSHSGEVSISFVLSRDGKLESVKGEGSDRELIDVAVKSVKESFPFLPFPPEFEGSICPFSVSILFKNN